MRRRIVKLMLLWSVFAIGQQPQHGTKISIKPPTNWERLKVWVNEYPLSKKRSIFDDAELHRALLHLLGNADYKRMKEDMGIVSPIQVIGGYLVIRGFTDRSKPRQEGVLILLGLNDSSVKVAFTSDQGVDWHPASLNAEANLPSCILFQLHVERGQ